MLKVPLRGSILGITWSHPGISVSHPVTRKVRDKFGVVHKKLILEVEERRSTVCTIYLLGADGKPQKEITHGTVTAYYTDPFKREGGRKLSLRRALHASDYTRAEREVIWTAYHRRPRLKSTPKTERVQEGSPSLNG